MTVHVIISGNVQGVGFRQYIKYKAKELNIKGWVKNIPFISQGKSIGNVEAIFTGKAKDVDKMIQFCKKGPVVARVEKVEVEELDSLPFNDFEIIKD